MFQSIMKPTSGDGAQSYLEAAAELVRNAKAAAARSINLALVYTNFELGRIIVEEEQAGENRAAYGKHVLEELSSRLTSEFGKGYSVENLTRARKFYLVYGNDEISSTLLTKFGDAPATSTGRRFYLSWSHYLKLMRMDNADKRHFYEIEAARESWSLSELERQCASGLYERTAISHAGEVERLAEEGVTVEKPTDAIKDPYILEFLDLDEKSEYSETDLETLILDHLQDFLLELGKGFLFSDRQKRFTFEEDHFKVDLVFYNRLLRCFVLFDLKTGKLTHQDIGQMQMYVNYYDRMVKTADENPTIGVLLCEDKNDAVVRMTLPEDNERIFASKYELVLPTEEELKQLMADARSEAGR